MSYMSRERFQWGHMTEAQLLTRLGKTKNREKLDCFIRLAWVYGCSFLEQEGHDRWNYLFADRHVLQRSGINKTRTRKPMALAKKPKIIREPEFRMIR